MTDGANAPPNLRASNFQRRPAKPNHTAASGCARVAKLSNQVASPAPPLPGE